MEYVYPDHTTIEEFSDAIKAAGVIKKALISVQSHPAFPELELKNVGELRKNPVNLLREPKIGYGRLKHILDLAHQKIDQDGKITIEKRKWYK